MQQASALEHKSCEGDSDDPVCSAQPSTYPPLGLVVARGDDAHDLELERWADSMNT